MKAFKHYFAKLDRHPWVADAMFFGSLVAFLFAAFGCSSAPKKPVSQSPLTVMGVSVREAAGHASQASSDSKEVAVYATELRGITESLMFGSKSVRRYLDRIDRKAVKLLE